MSSTPLRLAVRPTMRAMPLATIVGGAACGAVPLVVARAFWTDASALFVLFAVALIAAAAGFAFDDSAAVTLESSPTTIGRRRGLRIAITASVLATAWGCDLFALRRGDVDSALVFNRFTLALCALAASAVAIAAAVNRHEVDQQGGAVGATSAALMVAAAEFFSARWPTQFPSVINDGAPNQRWWWLLAAAIAVIAWCNRDPGRPRRLG
ncbi:MAG: hypothetical protein QOI95_567 [Acidimicrobiaceae bacterium]|jgi:hypothetical protein